MTAKQIVDRIGGKPDEDWSLAQCCVVERQGDNFGLLCHAKQGNTGVMRSFEIPITRQRAFKIVSLEADGNADMLSWEINRIFCDVCDRVLRDETVRKPV